MCMASLSNVTASPVVNLASYRPCLHKHSLAKNENVFPSHLKISCIQATLFELHSAHAQIYKTNLELSRVDARPVVGGEIFAADSPHLKKLIYTLLEERLWTHHHNTNIAR